MSAAPLFKRLGDPSARIAGRSEAPRLKKLEDENRKLKQLVADLSLDMKMLEDVVSGKLYGPLVGERWSSSSEFAAPQANEEPAGPWDFPEPATVSESVRDEGAELRIRLCNLAASKLAHETTGMAAESLALNWH